MGKREIQKLSGNKGEEEEEEEKVQLSWNDRVQIVEREWWVSK